MLIRQMRATGPMFTPTPDECEVLGGILLQALQFWHEHPVTAAPAWAYLIRLLIAQGALCVLDPYREEQCEHEDGLYSGDSLPAHVHSVGAPDYITPLPSDARWLEFCWPPETQT